MQFSEKKFAKSVDVIIPARLLSSTSSSFTITKELTLFSLTVFAQPVITLFLFAMIRSLVITSVIGISCKSLSVLSDIINFIISFRDIIPIGYFFLLSLTITIFFMLYLDIKFCAFHKFSSRDKVITFFTIRSLAL